jgi:NADPH:quinone reductase-like Zn-dependent oxidoreductase
MEMQVAGIRRVGARVEMIEAGEPRPLAGDEVLLEVRAAGGGNWDEFVRTGGWAPGDAVMTHPVPLRDQGTWAPRLIAPAGLLGRKPPRASWEIAAAFPVPALTAEQVLSDALNIRAGEQLLVHGAGGVTGGLLVALGALRGAQVIATAGPASQQRVSALGARQVIDYDDQEWPEQVRAITGRHGVAAAVNAAPQTRPASSAASPSPASTSARTETSCANSRSDSRTGSLRFRSPPATTSPTPPRH